MEVLFSKEKWKTGGLLYTFVYHNIRNTAPKMKLANSKRHMSLYMSMTVIFGDAHAQTK